MSNSNGAVELRVVENPEESGIKGQLLAKIDAIDQENVMRHFSPNQEEMDYIRDNFKKLATEGRLDIEDPETILIQKILRDYFTDGIKEQIFSKDEVGYMRSFIEKSSITGPSLMPETYDKGTEVTELREKTKKKVTGLSFSERQTWEDAKRTKDTSMQLKMYLARSALRSLNTEVIIAACVLKIMA